MGKLTVNVSDELYRALKKQASIKNRSLGSILEEAVRASKCFPVPSPPTQGGQDRGIDDPVPRHESKSS